jgi:hypothetical protein
VAEYWNDAEKQARAHAKSGLKGQALSEARNARDVAGARYEANLRRYWDTPSWAKEGAYAKAGGGFGKSVGNLGSEVGALRGAKGIPVVGAIASGVSTAVDIEQGVEPTRAIAANAASLVVTTALVALATGPAMPFVATALVIGVVGYGVGNLVHGAIAYGDFAHDFKSDWKGVTDGARWAGDKAGGAARAVGRFFKGSPLW